MVGQTVDAPCGEKYFVSPAHRMAKATRDKCVWTITWQDELGCFDYAFQNAWLNDNFAWGLMLSGNSLTELGVNYFAESLRLAKFLKNSGEWHGYPADVNRRVHDRPTPTVLTIWHNNNLISKSQKARIMGGRL